MNGYLLPPTPAEGLAGYVASGGGEGLARALALTPDDVIAEVTSAGLRGRGGAGFPTGRKWRSVVDAGHEAACAVYVVCNAAEGEPGTSKDRALMAQAPHQLLEGVLIALHALSAESAYIATKGSFVAEADALRVALNEMVKARWDGAERLDLLEGPDDYLFGEEKAMLEVIEGNLPMPRLLPPYMLGLFATTTRPNPTVVNNAETLSHVRHILVNGAAWFRSQGTQEAPGTMPFTVGGDVEHPGVYELPLGTPLRTLLVDLGGATDIKAVYSGVSNPVILPGLLDLPMDFESFAEAGTGLGSGGFLVYDSGRCIVRVAAGFARFLAAESCGQCIACKLGTAEIAQRLTAVDQGVGTPEDLDHIRQRAVTVTDQARCGLPIGAQALISTLETFADEFTAHLGRPCPEATRREVALQ